MMGKKTSFWSYVFGPNLDNIGLAMSEKNLSYPNKMNKNNKYSALLGL